MPERVPKQSAAAGLRAAREELNRAGGRFEQPRYWLVRYVWRATVGYGRRVADAATYWPLTGPGSAIVLAHDVREVDEKLRSVLLSSDLVEVLYAEPWGDQGTMVVHEGASGLEESEFTRVSRAWLRHRGGCETCGAGLRAHGLRERESGTLDRQPEREVALEAALCDEGRALRAAYLAELSPSGGPDV